MKLNFFILLTGLILVSCSEDCSKCEEQLKSCRMMEPVTVNLPKPENRVYDDTEPVLIIEVNAEDKYIFEEEEYSLDEVTLVIDEKMEDIDPDRRKMKILGDKMAHFDAVYALITLANDREYQPILAFSE